MTMGLDSLGVTHAEQRVYEALLDQGGLTLARLNELTGISRTQLAGLLKSLEALGMLSRTADKPALFVPAPPDIAVEVLAARRTEEIARARLAGVSLSARFPGEGGSPIQLVRGRETVGHRFHQLKRVAKHELLILDKPPFVVEPDGGRSALQRELHARGVRCRTVYDRDDLDATGRFDDLKQATPPAEQVRVAAGLPMTLVVVDRRLGLVPYELPDGDHSLLLRSSALLNGLVLLFEGVWERASPVWPGAEEPLTTDDQQLLALLAAGLTDQAIARKLGVAKRTVERRIRRLMDSLGAQTRFQAGLQAAIRGLFDVP